MPKEFVNTFDRLAQASQARRQAIDSAREAFLAQRSAQDLNPKTKKSTKLPLATKIAGSMILTGSAVLAACGGTEGSQDGQTETSRSTQTPTATESLQATATATETETVVPTEEPIPPEQLQAKKDEVFQLYTEALAQSGLNSSNYPDQDATNPTKIKAIVDICNTDRQPFDPWGDGTIVEPSNPEYGNILDGRCQTMGDFTGRLYKETGNSNFLLVNQEWKIVHKAVFDSLSKDYPYLDAQSWQGHESRYYSLK